MFALTGSWFYVTCHVSRLRCPSANAHIAAAAKFHGIMGVPLVGGEWLPSGFSLIFPDQPLLGIIIIPIDDSPSFSGWGGDWPSGSVQDWKSQPFFLTFSARWVQLDWLPWMFLVFSQKYFKWFRKNPPLIDLILHHFSLLDGFFPLEILPSIFPMGNPNTFMDDSHKTLWGVLLRMEKTCPYDSMVTHRINTA